jgi:DNA-directed RNA polymerase beta' subunit
MESKKHLYEILLNKKNKYANNTKTEKKIKKYKNQLKLINYFFQTNSKPHWIIIKYLPVLPPNIRPIIKYSLKE